MNWDLPKVEGFEEVKYWLKKLSPSELRRYGSGVLRQVVYTTEAEVKPYPPNGPWNEPRGPGSSWYERHFGPRYMTVNGQIHGWDTSERLQQQWEGRKISNFEYELSNGASYSIYVIGSRQRKYHRKHGWRNITTILRIVKTRHLPRIIRFFIMHFD